VLAALTGVELGLGAHLRTTKRAVPLVIVEPLDGLIPAQSYPRPAGNIGDSTYLSLCHIESARLIPMARLARDEERHWLQNLIFQLDDRVFFQHDMPAPCAISRRASAAPWPR
jgi:hypothetical protein